MGQKKPGLNTNILSGEDGGGGGGGGYRGMGGGGGTENSAYNKYMPNAAADPRRATASQDAIRAQIGTGGSLPMWEKINARSAEWIR